MKRIRVLLLFGGESSEHEISVSSASNVYAAMTGERYDVYLCYIDKTGKWWLVSDINKLDKKLSVVPCVGEKSILVPSENRGIELDVIFPVLHGRNGEDGSMQGLAQLMHLPIVGCDVTASGVAMNKLAFKNVLEASGISVIPYEVHRDYDEIPSFESLTGKLGDILFVKPARSGSSVGVSKVTNELQLKKALNEAHKHDPIALIEKAIDGQELEVAVLGTPPNHSASGVGEIIPGEEFYSYDDKYAEDSKARVNITANISDEKRDEIRQVALDVFEAMDCSNLARIDFMMSSNGKVYVMEANTIPGFTNISMYPKLWKQEGLSYEVLIDKLVDDAMKHAPIINTER